MEIGGQPVFLYILAAMSAVGGMHNCCRFSGRT